MITEAVVSNFKSIGEDVHLKLGSLTALVGPNGSGKSNLADVFRFVAEAMRNGLEVAIQNRHGINVLRRWSTGHPYNMTIQLGLSEKTFTGSYTFSIGGAKSGDYRVKSEDAVLTFRDSSRVEQFHLREGKFEGPIDIRPKVARTGLTLTLLAGDERFSPLADALRNISIYTIFPDTLRKPQKPDTLRPMNQHGENWAAILQGLMDEETRNELIAAMAKLTGDIEAFRVRQIGGYLNSEFRHRTPRTRRKDRVKWFESVQESDGTLRVAGILTALLQSPPLTLIGVEEPELTVHVGALPLLLDYIKQAVRRGQVLLTTHSIELLELLDVDDIRVVQRTDGITTVAPVRSDQRESVKNRLLTVGDIVTMEGGLQQEMVLKTGETR